MDQYINYGNGVIKTINIVPEGKYITYNISIVSDVKDHKCISYSFVTENIFEYITSWCKTSIFIFYYR